MGGVQDMNLNLFSHMGAEAFNTIKAEGEISVFYQGRFLLTDGEGMCCPPGG